MTHRVSVIGAGAWGTALACLLNHRGHNVTLWGRTAACLDEIRAGGRNDRFLPGIPVPREIRIESDALRAVRDADCLVVAVPSEAFRQVTSLFGGFGGIVVSVTKGIEYDTGLTMCGILAQTVPRARHVALSGPSFATEVAHGVPTAIVAGSSDVSAASAVQRLFSSPAFRVYTSTDCQGVELGGALKNVVAIAAGASDGLGFGDNAKAALVTRAIVEIRRVGVACGAKAETFTGLSGLGDLVATCFSRHSRNRAFGERVARGERPEAISASSLSVAEGYPTTMSARQLARKHDVITPVLDEVFAILCEGKDAASAVVSLLTREVKPEL